MNNTTIFFDMDGLICDFVTAALKTHSLQTPDEWTLVQGDPLGRRMDIQTHFGMCDDVFWAPIHALGEAFWLDLEPLADGMDLYAQLAKKYTVLICTTPSHHPSSSSGKIRWLQKHFSPRFRDYVLAPEKWRLAHPGAVLIDDYDTNVVEFRRRSGHAWLFPRPWNSGGLVVNKLDLEQTLARASKSR